MLVGFFRQTAWRCFGGKKLPTDSFLNLDLPLCKSSKGELLSGLFRA
jgi:hypothetical protein